MDNERVPTRCEYMMEHIVDEISYWKNRRMYKKNQLIILPYYHNIIILPVILRPGVFLTWPYHREIISFRYVDIALTIKYE